MTALQHRLAIGFLMLGVSTWTAAAASAATWQPSSGHAQLEIWPGTPPDAPDAGAESPETVGVSAVTATTVAKYRSAT
jgi:hypothetical protein